MNRIGSGRVPLGSADMKELNPSSPLGALLLEKAAMVAIEDKDAEDRNEATQNLPSWNQVEKEGEWRQHGKAFPRVIDIRV